MSQWAPFLALRKLRYYVSKALGNQTQATRRRALDSTAHADFFITPCSSCVAFPVRQSGNAQCKDQLISPVEITVQFP